MCGVRCASARKRCLTVRWVASIVFASKHSEMSNDNANVSVWVGEEFVCIKLEGRANFQCGVAFKAVVQSLFEKGHRRFVIEASGCQLMDSTFLGVLAAVALRIAPKTSSAPATRLELLNPTERVLDTLDNLGIKDYFIITKSGARPDGDYTPVGNPPIGPDRKETTQTCLEAHRLLMELNPANVAKFKDVTKFLEEDLDRMEKKTSP